MAIHMHLVGKDFGRIRKGVGILAAIVLVPVVAVAQLLTLPFGRPARSSPAEVAAFLRDFLNGTGHDWDWDDFTAVRLADPALDSIRRRAAEIALPLDAEGKTMLEHLLAEAERLSL